MSLVLGTPSWPQLSLFGPPVPHLQNGCPGDDLTGLTMGLRETTAVRQTAAQGSAKHCTDPIPSLEPGPREGALSLPCLDC